MEYIDLTFYKEMSIYDLLVAYHVLNFVIVNLMANCLRIVFFSFMRFCSFKAYNNIMIKASKIKRFPCFEFPTKFTNYIHFKTQAL